MKIARVKASHEKCVGCRICELTCSNVNFKVNNPAKSAIYVEELDGVEGFKVYVCNQCGVCAKYCPAEAISLVNGAYRIDEEKCVRCGTCVEVCPSKAIWWRPGIEYPVKCVSCGACVENCPTGALSLEEVEVG